MKMGRTIPNRSQRRTALAYLFLLAAVGAALALIRMHPRPSAIPLTLDALSQVTALQFPPRAALLAGAPPKPGTNGGGALFAVVRLPRSDADVFLSQPRLQHDLPAQAVGARASLNLAPKEYGFDSPAWHVADVKQADQFYFNEPDLGLVLVDRDDPQSITIYILYL